MSQIQFIQVTPEQLEKAIIEGVKTQLNDLKQHFQPKEPNQYLTTKEVSQMLSIGTTTVFNWTKRGVLNARQIGGRVLYLRSEIESAIVELQN